jgi:hypothetical protein
MPGTGNNLPFVLAAYAAAFVAIVGYALYVHRAVRAAKAEYDAVTSKESR